MSTGYKTICISLYDADLVALDAKVADLKERGYRRTNRSQLIRLALQLLDTRNVEPVEQVPTKIVSKRATAADLKATEQANRARPERLLLTCHDCELQFNTSARRGPLVARCYECRLRHEQALRAERESA
jgi:hypothetical protein